MLCIVCAASTSHICAASALVCPLLTRRMIDSLIYVLFSYGSALNTGQPCRCCTRSANCRVGIIIFLEAWRSLGWDTMKAASPQTRAALTSGTQWRTWRQRGPTPLPCLSTSQLTCLELDSVHKQQLRATEIAEHLWCSYGFIFGRPSERERTECLIKAKLRSIMTCQDLENVTCKQVRRAHWHTHTPSQSFVA